MRGDPARGGLGAASPQNSQCVGSSFDDSPRRDCNCVITPNQRAPDLDVPVLGSSLLDVIKTATLYNVTAHLPMHELTIEGVGTFEVEEGTRLVRAIEDSGVDVGHRCGGQAKCTTCRVNFKEGEPGVMTKAEYEKLTDIGQFDNMRLSCQIVVDRDMTIEPLMTVEEQGWDDPGPEPSITVEPEPEWHPIETLEAEDADA